MLFATPVFPPYLESPQRSIPALFEYVWQDDQTRFALVRRTGDQGPQHLAVLSDVALAPSTPLPDITQIGVDTVAPTMDDILATTEVWGFIVGKPVELIESIRTYHPDLHPDTLVMVKAALEEHYAPFSLYRHIRRHMKEHSSEDVVTHLIDWLFDDAMVIQQATVDAYEPELTLEAYAASLQDARPPQERINLMMRFVKTNQVGTFYVGLQTAVRDATNKILASLPGASDPIPAPSLAERSQMEMNFDFGAIVAFLWRYQPLTDEQIEQTVDWYETESGQWYVQAYTEALTSALTAAGENVANQIRGL